MNQPRYDELLGRVLDDEITSAELAELGKDLRGQPDRLADLRFHLVLWEVFSQQRRPERSADAFVASWRTRLAAETQAATFVERTVERLEPSPPSRPIAAPERSDRASIQPSTKSRLLELLRLAHTWNWRAWVAAAACLVLVAGLGVWYFGPTMGKPVLAEVQGAGLSLERADQPLPAIPGTRLQNGDMLRTSEHVSAAISFGPEKTRITIQPGTELTLGSMSRGKRFNLSAGKLEASVARQRPFQPLVLVTPQAQARVLGTKFSLLTTSEQTRLEVTEGSVQLSRLSDAVSVKVPAGNYAVVSSNSVPAPLFVNEHQRSTRVPVHMR